MTSQRLGLAMIAGALLAIVAIGAVFTLDVQKRRSNEIRADGVALARLLGSFSYDELAPQGGGVSVLESLRTRIGRSALIYAAVVDESGRIRAYAGIPGALDLAAPSRLSSQNWLGEHEVETVDGRKVIEFNAPVVQDGRMAGTLLVGFLKPTLGLALTQIPFLAQLALPVFLLIPFFYYLLRREMDPLREASLRLAEVAARGAGEPATHVLTPSEDLRSFMNNFDRFLKLADSQVQQARTQQADVLVHHRLLSYEKGRIEAALQSMPDGVMVVDETGQVSFMNDNLSLLLRVTRDEVLDKPVGEWCVDEPVCAFLSRFNGGKSLHKVETLEFIPVSNPEKSISVNAFPLFSPKETSSVYGAVVLFRDVSAEVMARGARDEFVTHVAHEVKSPLNVINMQAETLAEFGADDAEIRVNAVNVIQDEVDRLSRMIGDLLNITQIEAGSVAIDRKPVKLRELLEDAFTTTVRVADARGIVPHLDLPRSLPTIQADKDLLRLALNNVLTNAIKYNREGGTVTLTAMEHDDCVQISITDEGIGIAVEEQHRVFDKFYRSDDAGVRAREGHGLGLALAKQVIDLHHGSVRVESEVGEGSTFTISLKKEMRLLKVAV